MNSSSEERRSWDKRGRRRRYSRSVSPGEADIPSKRKHAKQDKAEESCVAKDDSSTSQSEREEPKGKFAKDKNRSDKGVKEISDNSNKLDNGKNKFDKYSETNIKKPNEGSAPAL